MGACCGGMKTSQQHKSLPEKSKATASENEHHQLNNDVVAPTVSQETCQPVTPNNEHNGQSVESNHEDAKHNNVAEQPETLPAQELDVIVANGSTIVSSEAATSAEGQPQPVGGPVGDGDEQQVGAELESVQLRISEDTDASIYAAAVEVDEVIQSQSETILECWRAHDTITVVPTEANQGEKFEEQRNPEIPDEKVTSLADESSFPAAEEQNASNQQATSNADPISEEITAVVEEAVETSPRVEPDFGFAAVTAEETQAAPVEKIAEKSFAEVSDGQTLSASSVESSPAEQITFSEQATSSVEPISEIIPTVQETVETLPAVEPDVDLTAVPAEETQAAPVEKVEEPFAEVSDGQTLSASSVESSPAEEQTTFSERATSSVEPISEIIPTVQETVETLPAVKPDVDLTGVPAEETQAAPVEKVEEPFAEVSDGQTLSASSVESSPAEEQTTFSEQATSSVEPISEIIPAVQETVETLPAVEPDVDLTAVPAEETQAAPVEKVEEQASAVSEVVSDSTLVPVVGISGEQSTDASDVVPEVDVGLKEGGDIVQQQTQDSSLPVTDEQLAPNEQDIIGDASATVSDVVLESTARVVEEHSSAVAFQDAEESTLPDVIDDVKTEDVVERQQALESSPPQAEVQVATSEQDMTAVETLPESNEPDAVLDSAATVVTSSEEQAASETATAGQEDADSELIPNDLEITGNNEIAAQQEVTSSEAVGHVEDSPAAILEPVVASGDEAKVSAAEDDVSTEQPSSSVEQSTPETAQTETSAAESISNVDTVVVSQNSDAQSPAEPVAQEEEPRNQNNETVTDIDRSLSVQCPSNAEASSVETQQLQTLSADALPMSNQVAGVEQPSITITDQEQNAVSTSIDPPAQDTTPASEL